MAHKCATCAAKLGQYHFVSCAIRNFRNRVRVELGDCKIYECGCAVWLHPDGRCPHYNPEDERSSLDEQGDS